MAQTSDRLAVQRNATLNSGSRLPKLSTALDSVRTYQFEVQFTFPEGAQSEGLRNMSLAAKQVGAAGIKVEPIEVHRLNDRYFYPGKSNTDELKITFDNLFATKAGANLFAWFRACTYDPITGYQSPISSGASRLRSFKAEKVRIIQYDGTMTPFSYVDFIGVFPVSVTMAEHNYSTNEFHTIDCTFRYDFIDMFNSTVVNTADLTSGFFPN